MGRMNAILLAVLVGAVSPATAQEAPDRQALAMQIQQRFTVLPLQDGVVLTPRTPIAQVRSIQLTGGTIAIDGQPVTGAELRKRLAADADLIIQLSYLESAEQRTLFDAAPPPSVPPLPETTPGPTPPAPPEAPAAPRRSQRRSDVVRVGGSVVVGPEELIDGDVVAIGGGASVDGEVNGDVVAIGGDLQLGPNADIDGDAVVIGGVLRRDPGARISGDVQEIGFPAGGFSGFPAGRVGDLSLFGPRFGSFFALVGTIMRLAVLAILVSIVFLFGRDYVERVGLRAATEPVKAGAVGLLIQLLFVPVLVATIFILVVTIIGIPLLVLVPFALLAFVLVFLIGFTAVAYDIGRLATVRFGWQGLNPYLVAVAGVALVLSPILIARLVGFGGSFLWPISWSLLIIGFCAEYLAWTVGLGAVALVRFNRA